MKLPIFDSFCSQNSNFIWFTLNIFSMGHMLMLKTLVSSHIQLLCLLYAWDNEPPLSYHSVHLSAIMPIKFLIE